MMTETENLTSKYPTILIIDGDASLLELFERTLSHDYQVYTCSTKHDALEILSTHRPQLVVLEPATQRYRGWELFREIIDTYKIPVIVSSALDDRKRGLDAGAVAYLVKPVLPMTLLQVLEQALNQSTASSD